MARRPKKGAVEAIAAVQPLPTIIEFLLDETGSMTSIKQPTISGFNDFLADQRKLDGLALFTLTKFDSMGLRTPYTDVDVKLVPALSHETFIPGASTNLREAIVARSSALRSRLRTWSVKPHVLFICMTDGQDNASSLTEEAVRSTITENSADGWTYAYLGADQNALHIASRLGFAEGNVKAFASAEMRQTFHQVAAATSSYRATRAAAAQAYSSTDYFSSVAKG